MEVQGKTVQVSYRLPAQLIARLRRATRKRWPPGPSQTDVVVHGIELALAKLRKNKRRQ